MSDKVLRDEIWESDRFIGLPTDTARVAFMRFLSVSDDFGNFEGGGRKIHRMLESCTQAKTDSAIEHTIDALMAVDLIRRYTVGDRELFHIPRTKSHRQYIVRKMPPSPWDLDQKLGKTQRIEARGLAKDDANQPLEKNVDTTSLLRSMHVAQGVGVGVGVGDRSIVTSSLVNDAKASPTKSGKYKRPDCPTEAIVDLYHANLPGLPRADILTPIRKKHIATRWAEVCGESKFDKEKGLDWFSWFFGEIGKSPFLMGKVKGRNGDYFRCTLDWAMHPEKFARVVEGFYSNRSREKA